MTVLRTAALSARSAILKSAWQGSTAKEYAIRIAQHKCSLSSLASTLRGLEGSNFLSIDQLR